MSTRCQIGIFESVTATKPTVLLYKHSDGYEEGVLPTLIPFCERFNKARGLDDTEYLAAWCLYEFMAQHRAWAEEYQKEHPHMGETFHFTGFGICGGHGLHGDIEYFYRVDPEKVQVLRPPDFPDTGSNAANYDQYEELITELKNWRVSKTIILKRSPDRGGAGVARGLSTVLANSTMGLATRTRK